MKRGIVVFLLSPREDEFLYQIHLLPGWMGVSATSPPDAPIDRGIGYSNRRFCYTSWTQTRRRNRYGKKPVDQAHQ